MTLDDETLLEFDEDEIPSNDKSSPSGSGLSPIMAISLFVLLGTLLTTAYLAFNFILPGLLASGFTLVSIAGIMMFIFIGIAILYGLIFIFVNRIARGFFGQFHQPPEGTKSADLISNHMSDYGPSIPIRGDHLSPEQSWVTWLGGPAKLIINDGFAVYVEHGSRFSRIIGPGIARLKTKETIKGIVDLRPIVREGEVEAWTKDGIQIKLVVRMSCQIGRAGSADESEKLVYPFNAEDVKKAVEQMAVSYNAKKKHLVESTWVDRVWGKVKGFLIIYISSHTMDELFLAEWGPSQITSQETWKKILRELNEGLVDFGAHILNLQITNFKIPEEVNRQRTKTWEAEKESAAAISFGQTNADGIREREKARAEAEKEMIFNIARQMEQMDAARLQETILLSLSGMLDQNLSDPYARTYVTSETLDTLEKLKKLL